MLMVPPGSTNWSIRPSVESTKEWIYSPAAPLCAASERAAHSEKDGEKGWHFYNGTKWVAGDITVTCSGSNR